MDDEFEAVEMEEDDSPEFTLAEVLEMEIMFKKLKEKPITQEFCEGLATKFSCSSHRSEKPPIKWQQVQSWFEDKQTHSTAKAIISSPREYSAIPKPAVIKKRSVKVSTISASKAAEELSNLMFEARSAKDYAWFDVASFLMYRVLCSGEVLVRVRFAGFGKEEDEWVSVKKAVRERSIPLEPYECGRVNVGDLVLCYREAEDHALYCDAHIVEIERKPHDSNDCTCIFAVRFDHDNFEAKVPVGKMCYRPTQSVSVSVSRVSEVGEDCRSLQFEMGNLMLDEI